MQIANAIASKARAAFLRPTVSRASGATAGLHSSAPSYGDNESTIRRGEHQWADPAARQYKFWNREEQRKADKGKFSYMLEISPDSLQREARIVCLSAVADDANAALHDSTGSANKLPMGASLMGVGETVEALEETVVATGREPNVAFVSPSCPMARVQVPKLLERFPSIEWVHCRSAGIDFIASDELAQFKSKNLACTNAKGQFSSSLAEYTMMAMSYFAKDLPRLMRQQQAKDWNKYDVEELRGKTLGIVGYGDVGRACAKIASVYGMRIVALRRHPYLSKFDPLCDVVYGRDKSSLHQLLAESDYVLCSAPSTVETRGMVGADAFSHIKEGAVFINLGRGPVVDEPALYEALKSGKLKGAALDVFTEEPLPSDNPMWELPNVLISPHNMDQTATFMHEATEFFVNENLPRFMIGEDLLNPVDVELGY